MMIRWLDDDDHSRAVEAIGREIGMRVRCRRGLVCPLDADDDFEPHIVYQARYRKGEYDVACVDFCGIDELPVDAIRDFVLESLERL